MNLCGFPIGLDRPLFLIAGPCVVESEQLQIDVAGQLKEITSALGMPFIFKSSYDKANRSSGSSFRGPGMEKGLQILAKVKKEVGVPVLTDVHTEAEIPAAAAVVDVLQTPAFLCRQTDFIRAVAQSGKPVNIKKGQFLAPHDMKNVIGKARAAARRAERLAQNGETPIGQPITLPQTEAQAETSMTPPDNDDKTARDAKLAAARAKSEERRIAHAKLKQHMRDTAIPIRPQPDEHQ